MKRNLCGATRSTVCAVMLLLFLVPPVGAADDAYCCLTQPPMYYERSAFTTQANPVQFFRVTCKRVTWSAPNDNTSHLCAKVSGTHWECSDEKDKSTRQINNWTDLNSRYSILCGACGDMTWETKNCFAGGGD